MLLKDAECPGKVRRQRRRQPSRNTIGIELQLHSSTDQLDFEVLERIAIVDLERFRLEELSPIIRM